MNQSAHRQLAIMQQLYDSASDAADATGGASDKDWLKVGTLSFLLIGESAWHQGGGFSAALWVAVCTLSPVRACTSGAQIAPTLPAA
jgi:hypothetical protein